MDMEPRDVKDISRKTGRHEGVDVLNKVIFSNVFEKDIKRVYIYKKVERVAQAVHLIAPAFAGRPSLGERFDALALSLIDAAVMPSHQARQAISEKLLTLSSLLSVAHTANLLSPMNVDILSREIEDLLAEVTLYEEPRLALPESPSLAQVFEAQGSVKRKEGKRIQAVSERGDRTDHIRNAPEKPAHKDSLSKRQNDILGIIKDRGEVYIKDISSVLRDISEKTVQRELGSLIEAGVLQKAGERRWTRYSLASS